MPRPHDRQSELLVKNHFTTIVQLVLILQAYINIFTIHVVFYEYKKICHQFFRRDNFEFNLFAVNVYVLYIVTD
jgi:hypothetical protein